MIRFGTVSIVNNKKGTVKVTFEDLEIQSEELIVFQGRTTGTKEYKMPVIGEKGLCLIVDNGEIVAIILEVVIQRLIQFQ